jgi:hypothetical protein
MIEPAGFAQAVSVFVEALYDPWGTMSPHDKARKVLSALLAARMETPCPEGCDHGVVKNEGKHAQPMLRWYSKPCPNPDCHEGMVTTDTPLIVMGAELEPTVRVRDTPKFTLTPSVAVRLTKEPEDA